MGLTGAWITPTPMAWDEAVHFARMHAWESGHRTRVRGVLLFRTWGWAVEYAGPRASVARGREE